MSESIFGISLYCNSRSENCVFLEFRVAVVIAVGLRVRDRSHSGSSKVYCPIGSSSVNSIY